ncbi:MAG: hypothetical protein ABF979_11115 [Gluconobacter sp.]|uniref:hypothetical protein n=1 Tax=Gluconobacter sp. TaxID=1876758 RepID=UPI0039EBAD02
MNTLAPVVRDTIGKYVVETCYCRDGKVLLRTPEIYPVNARDWHGPYGASVSGGTTRAGQCCATSETGAVVYVPAAQDTAETPDPGDVDPSSVECMVAEHVIVSATVVTPQL